MTWKFPDLRESEGSHQMFNPHWMFEEDTQIKARFFLTTRFKYSQNLLSTRKLSLVKHKTLVRFTF